MKKTICALLIVCLLCSLTSCVDMFINADIGETADKKEPTTNKELGIGEDQKVPEEEPQDDEKTEDTSSGDTPSGETPSGDSTSQSGTSGGSTSSGGSSSGGSSSSGKKNKGLKTEDKGNEAPEVNTGDLEWQ